MRAKAQSRVCLLAFLLCAQQGVADETPMPGLEFFEYLGSLVETDGKWLGPEEMEALMKVEKSQKASEEKPREMEVRP